MKSIAAVAGALALSGAAAQQRVCDSGQPAAGTPLCQSNLPADQRVAWLVANLTLDEKVGLFNTQSAGVPRLNIPTYQWWSEALHGVGYSPGVNFGGNVPGATSFPQVCTTGMTYNRSLWRAIGSVVSTEARAMNNVGRAGLTFWTPNINVFRDPRWGRGQETTGEDPYVNGQYAARLVRGLQEGDDPRYLKVSSCSKHYAAYSLESWGGEQRYGFNAIVTAQDEADTYLPAFAAAVTQGHVSSIMCSYNAVNSVPSCANSFLLRDIAKGEWQFQGYITSDCDAVNNILNPHHYVNNASAMAQVALEGGTDIDCGGALVAALPAALKEGLVTESLLDPALFNLFMVRLRLGVFDPAANQPYLSLGPSDICTDASKQLALDAAHQGLTLLKNVGGTLPLSKAATKTLAVVGPNANNPGVMASNYNGAPCPGTLVPPATTLGAYATVTYEQGCKVADPSTNGIPAAIAAAQAADATIIVAGLDLSQEAEGLDRTIISWPGVQAQMIAQVAAAAKGPVVLVIMAGGSVDITQELANPKIGAIVWAGYPGQAGGEAIAHTLFGDNVPSGRLVQTLYPAGFTANVSLFDMNMRPGPSAFAPGTNPGRTHRFYTGPTVLPFGFGLSYTTFSYSVVEAPAHVSLAPSRRFLADHPNHGGAYAPAPTAADVGFVVNVTNTGSIDAADTVLGFLVPPGAGAGGVPLQTLFGFERVFVPAGQTVSVFLGATAMDLTHVTTDAVRVPLAGRWGVRFGVAAGLQAGAGFAETTFEASD